MAAALPKPRALAAGPRVLALATCLMVGVHLLLLVVAPHGWGWTVVLLLMTAWCLKCALSVLKGGSLQTLMLMSALMGLVHVVMALGLPGAVAHHAAQAGSAHLLHAMPMLAVGVCELVLTFFAALLIHRSRERTVYSSYAL